MLSQFMSEDYPQGSGKADVEAINDIASSTYEKTSFAMVNYVYHGLNKE